MLYVRRMVTIGLTSETMTVFSGAVQAIKLMKSQPSGGHIFLMDGAGADGNATPRFAAYGASKRGLSQLRKSLQVIAAARLHPSADFVRNLTAVEG